MQIVISPSRALAEGFTPEDLIVVAKWHEERASVIGKAVANKKRRAYGSLVTADDAARHAWIAGELRTVAARVGQILAATKAAA